MNDLLRAHPAWSELRALVQRLALISHVSGISYDGKVARDTSESIGGRKPPGGDAEREKRLTEDEKEAWRTSYLRRSASYFEAQIVDCHTVGRLIALRDEAQKALEAWQRQPLPRGQEPEYGTPQWKRFIAESHEDGGSLARRFHVTRQYIAQIRKQYRAA